VRRKSTNSKGIDVRQRTGHAFEKNVFRLFANALPTLTSVLTAKAA